MSGSFRQYIGLAKGRLQQNIIRGLELLDQQIDATNSELINDIYQTIDRLNSNIERIENKSQEWVSFLQSLPPDKLDNEQKLFDEWSGNDGGFINIVYNAQDLVADLQRMVRPFNEQFSTSTGAGSVTGESGGLGYNQPGSVLGNSMGPGPGVKLPKLELPKFDGNIKGWNEFWDIYEATVHNQNISKVQKFGYLKGCLLDGAKVAVEGIPITDSNYVEAISILKKRYGRSCVTRSVLYGELRKMKTCSSSMGDLRKGVDQMERILRQLKALGDDINHPSVVALLLDKLPMGTLSEISRGRDVDTQWEVDELRDSINQYLSIREESQEMCGFDNQSVTQSGNFERGGTYSNDTGIDLTAPGYSCLSAGTGTSVTGTVPKCAFCDNRHYSDSCLKFQGSDNRKEKLRGLRRCFICLGKHMSKHCDNRSKACLYCKRIGHHHASICRENRQTGQSANTLISHDHESWNHDQEPGPGTRNDTQSVNATIEQALVNPGDKVVLHSATVTLRKPNTNHFLTARVVLDCCSHRSFVLESFARKLCLDSEHYDELSVKAFMTPQPHKMRSQLVQMELFLKDGSVFPLQANVVPNATGPVHRNTIQGRDLFVIRNIPTDDLAEGVTREAHSFVPEILIGMDYFWKLVYPPGVPLPVLRKPVNLVSPLILTRMRNRTYTFWDMETIGIKEPLHQDDDEIAEKMFRDTIKYDGTRYQVTWPWKPDANKLPSNKQVALARFRSLSRRLNSDPPLLAKYVDIIDDQLNKGIIERIPAISHETNDNEHRVHYLSHHPVITPHKATTKVRVVFDASCKIRKDEISLNEAMFRGPVILPNLCGLLIRFRFHKIGVLADIEKAFLQVGLQASERDVTRFLWYKDPTNPSDSNLQEYRFCRVTFGVIASSFLLSGTINHHLDQHSSPWAPKLKDDVYVDNLVSGADTVRECRQLYLHGKDIFADASMNLREWISNDTTVNNLFSEKDKMSASVVKVLGVIWDLLEDTFRMSIKSDQLLKVNSKRDVLHAIAGIFDPLGFYLPATFFGRYLFQLMWLDGKKWDEPLDNNHKQLWNHAVHMLQNAESFPIPRFVGFSINSESPLDYQVITFVDASAKAYATSVYIRIAYPNQCKSSLIFAKLRLSPKPSKPKGKKISIPRLELMGLLIGARASKFVQQELKVPISCTTIFSDSQCALAWLNCKRPMSVFVQNRVNEIRNISKMNYFRYVPSAENPADIATKGGNLHDSKIRHLWLNGPEWLVQATSKWPSHDYTPTDQVHRDISEEIRPIHSISSAHAILLHTNFPIDAFRFSSLQKLLRVTVYCLRFIKLVVWNKAHTKPNVSTFSSIKNNGYISALELQTARGFWEFRSQIQVAAELRNNQPGSKKGIQKQLGLHLDDDGFVRCGGRLAKAAIPQSAQFPKFLPQDSHFTQLVIQDAHTKMLHSGTISTLGKVRLSYWIPKGRRQVQKVLSKCRQCIRFNKQPFKLPNFPCFPKERVTRSDPFQFTGLDYFGPVSLKQDQSFTGKAWICLYTCLATRAIHMEVVEDLSSEAFLRCFRRFVARRGRPELIISDNASTFKLAKNVLDAVWSGIHTDTNVQNYVAKEGIVWHFITELSPWKGGFYERIIGVVKSCLRKTIGKQFLRLHQLQTVIPEVEDVVNNRPITYLYGNLDSFPSFLTPADFLCGNQRRGFPSNLKKTAADPDYLPKVNNYHTLLDTWNHHQQKVEQFWHLWHREYLTSLRERYQLDHPAKKGSISREPEVGEIVLLREDNVPRGNWKLGQIITVDESGKMVSVKQANGHIFNRLLNFVIPMEIRSDIQKGSPTSQPSLPSSRPQRTAAKNAQAKIADMINDNTLIILSSLPGVLCAQQNNTQDATKQHVLLSSN